MAQGKEEHVTLFRRYPFREGEKIHIQDGPRKGDWLVVEVRDKTVVLRCPVSGFQAEWTRFCYFIEEKDTLWPADMST